ncbi:restriction endonuclease subunit S [Pseudoalteromonas luteoviolacea]|uniref:restriction endonuclease subunit S n=1 Tax=Pseudoalteromonas luteoviolacea TaxID=43657 RepID=UPI00114DD4C5|nr:restriction endonuclease subunit S [Pseudoalteromonas luteoviolacea]TQF71893.1 restriction endonuclease subunit S [Pseudoalteromonas luteoviolacea]
MTDINKLITDNIDVWTNAISSKASTGRGSNKKVEFTGIKSLRNLILELAVQGKLIKVDNSGVNPQNLLDQILDAKKELIRQKKLKKQKSLPPLSEEEVLFQAPKGWIWARLGEVTNYGVADKAEPTSVDDDCWVLELEDVEKSTSRLLKRVRFSERNFKSSKNRFVSGDVIYGKLRPYLDKVIVADEAGVCTTEMIPFRAYANLDSRFLRLLMKTPYFIDYANNSTHGMNLPRMGTDKARLAPILIAPIEEQKLIVKKVDELMSLCDQLEQQTEASIDAHQLLVEELLSTLTNSENAQDFEQNWARIAEHFDLLFTTEHSIEQLKQTILQLAVMGKLVPQDPTDEPASKLLERIAQEKEQLIKDKVIKKQPAYKASPLMKEFEIPTGWAQVSLGEIIQVSSGDGLTSRQMNPEGDIPVFGGNGINGYHDSHNVEKQTLVIGRVGFYCGSVHITPSKAWITDNAFNTYFSEENIDINFLSWLLKATDLAQNNNATAQPVISGKKIYPLRVLLPPLKEQKHISIKIHELYGICELLKDSITEASHTNVQLSEAVVGKALS